MTQRGTLYTIAGCMGSGKSDEMMREARRAVVAGERVLIAKPSTDSRTQKLWSRSGIEMECCLFEDGESLGRIVRESAPDIVCIDEAQFMDRDMVDEMLDLMDEGFDFIIAGLNQDFRGEPFGLMGELMARSDKVSLLNATCMKCKKKDAATMTQRLVDGKPSDWSADTIVIGDETPNEQNIRYEARCKDCHRVIGKPKRR